MDKPEIQVKFVGHQTPPPSGSPLRALQGMVKTVEAEPTGTPRSFFEQFRIFDGALWFYDTFTNIWQATGGGGGDVQSGLYTPTVTDEENIDTATPAECQYMRVGEVVTVSGRVFVLPTAATTYSLLRISLPIASNFSAPEQCGGTSVPYDMNMSGSIEASSAFNTALLAFISDSGPTESYWNFHFTYRIIT